MPDASQQQPAAPRAVWLPDGLGAVDEGAAQGYPHQAGPAWGRRLEPSVQPVDGAFAMINDSWYATFLHDENGEPCPDEFGIGNRTEFLVCTDPDNPGGTEVWSDYQYSEDSSAYRTLEDADAAARDTAENFFGDVFVWDGMSPVREISSSSPDL